MNERQNERTIFGFSSSYLRIIIRAQQPQALSRRDGSLPCAHTIISLEGWHTRTYYKSMDLRQAAQCVAVPIQSTLALSRQGLRRARRQLQPQGHTRSSAAPMAGTLSFS